MNTVERRFHWKEDAQESWPHLDKAEDGGPNIRLYTLNNIGVAQIVGPVNIATRNWNRRLFEARELW